MIRPFLLALIIGFFSLSLISCVAIQEQVVEPEEKAEPALWVGEQLQRQQIQTWEVRGRLGVQTEVTGGSMDIIWKNDGENFSIRLIAPLGAGSYLIQGNKHQAEIRFPNGSTKIIDNIDHVFSSVLEVDLPVSAVKDWMRGIPSKALSIENISWDDKGRLHRVAQSGWNVEMTGYEGDKPSMPYKLYVSREGDSELDVRLILSRWLIDN